MDPGFLAYCPAEQTLHVPDPTKSEYVPMLQEIHRFDPRKEYSLDLQMVHAVAPPSVEAVPGATMAESSL